MLIGVVASQSLARSTRVSSPSPLSVDAGMFTLSGTDATPHTHLMINTDAGSFLLTGTDATLQRRLSLVAGAGLFAMTGTAATLTKSGAFALSAGAGSFALTGSDAALIHARTISAGAGAFTMTGTAATLTHVTSDPNYANVVFLWEAEGTNNQNTGLVDGKNSRTITASGTGKLSTTQARIGSTSAFVGSGGFSLANNADWRLANSSNASPWTIEFSAFEGTLQTWEAFRVWDGSEKSWWLRLQTDGEIRLLASSDGTSSFSMDVTTSGLGITNGAWHDLCVEKDSSGKIRFYRGGVMKYSTTPANSVFFASTNSQLTLETQATSDAYLDHIRFTKAVARFATDTSYTFDATAYPTS